MSDVAIRVSHLGKQYKIGARRQRADTLRDALAGTVKRMFGGLGANGRPAEDNTIWALRDASFEVNRGEVLGVIGRNGAGKSTLLKILSRITEPTTGEVDLHGRVGSLLEVGTGFHQELSGRENIFLNGAIIGMQRREIQRQFDEIVDFAGVEQFIDTPVKHFSSGMYMRLAFAVAAHMQTEILLIDEVLAVGDAEFQKKCLGKMGEVARAGRTVLFVSHNMAAVQQLCQRGLVLQAGRVAFLGENGPAIAAYIRNTRALTAAVELANRQDRKGSQWLRFTRVTVHDQEGRELERILCGQAVTLRLYYAATREKRGAAVLVATNLTNERGQLMTNLNSVDVGAGNLDIFTSGYFQCDWQKFNFRSGTYTSDVFCSVNGDIVDWVQNAFTLEVEDGDYYGTGRMIEKLQGEVLVDHFWRSAQIDAAKIE